MGAHNSFQLETKNSTRKDREERFPNLNAGSPEAEREKLFTKLNPFIVGKSITDARVASASPARRTASTSRRLQCIELLNVSSHIHIFHRQVHQHLPKGPYTNIYLRDRMLLIGTVCF